MGLIGDINSNALQGNGSVAKWCLTLVTPWTVSCQALCPCDFPGKNTGVVCHFLLQGIFLTQAAAAAAKLLQSCPTLCNPIDDGPPGSPVPQIPQARTLEWVAISSSNA